MKPRGARGAGRQRKLHIGHFAFMRAVVQGLDPRDSWQRYLRHESEAPDARTVRSTIAWIRDEFAAAARRHARHGTARMVRMDASRIVETPRQLPSLEAFAAEHGLSDEREADQLAAYTAAFGDDTRRLRRRSRVVARQLEALRWLEGLVAQAPGAGDAVASWLNPALAAHLESAGIRTLAQLVERINGLGRGWHSGIRAVGAGKAQRVLAWLHQHQASLGLVIGAHVAQPRSRVPTAQLAALVAPATAVRPLDKLLLPPLLDGRVGTNRRPAPECRIAAQDDREAILAWLRAHDERTADPQAEHRSGQRPGQQVDHPDTAPLSNTLRAYRKEAERLLLWAVVQRGRALASLQAEDCAAYLRFVADPQPRERWCGPRARERWSPLWRPFEGPLSPAAQRHALNVVRSLFGYLVSQCYLAGNPWVDIALPQAPRALAGASRGLGAEPWAFIESRLAALPASSAHQRLAFAVHLLQGTGLRLSEAVAATVDDLQPAADDGGWWLQVAGPGARSRRVALSPALADELARYLAARGLAPDPQAAANRGAHLLGPAMDIAQRAPALAASRPPDPRAGVAATTLYDQIKAFFVQCADQLQAAGVADAAEQLRQAGTHTLRRLHARQALDRGEPLVRAREHLGHASTATTRACAGVDRHGRPLALRNYE